MADVIAKIHSMPRGLRVEKGVTPDAIYAPVKAAFCTKDIQLMQDDEPDVAPLPALNVDWRAPWAGFDAPAPRSGGDTYVDLCLIYEACLFYEELFREVEGKRVASGDVEVAEGLVGDLLARELDLRSWWYRAGMYVNNWVNQLYHAALIFPRDDLQRARRWMRQLEPERIAQLRRSTVAARRKRRSGCKALLTCAGIQDRRLTDWLSEATLECQTACKAYLRCIDELVASEGKRNLPHVLAQVHALEAAGNRLCAASATLTSPALLVLHSRLLRKLSTR